MKKVGLVVLFTLLAPIGMVSYLLYFIFEALSSLFEMIGVGIAALIIGHS